MVDVRFLLHRGGFAGPKGLESLTASPTGVYCLRATHGDRSSILRLGSHPGSILQLLVPCPSIYAPVEKMVFDSSFI
ncbi:MAG: hypothetical protein RTU63_00330 [Candidatus Thorarchaeota archaeon]